MSLKNDSKKISILGCGWLGFPLAKALLGQDFKVLGSTTTSAKLPVLAEAGISPFLIDLQNLQPSEELNEFLSSEILILNVPPKKSAGNQFLPQLQQLRKMLLNSGVRNILFVSSTGAYLPSTEIITEESPVDENSELVAAENLFTDQKDPWQTMVLRLAGLFGPERQPGKFLAGRANLPDPDLPVNLIHQADCIGLISEIIRQQLWGQLLNGCADAHPSRHEFYAAAARKLNLPEPTFAPQTEGRSGKLISNEKAKSLLHYQFHFPDPLEALEHF